MKDHYKLQLAIYRLLLFGEDQLFIFKGEKEMNLTKKHRFLVNNYKDGEWDTVAKFDKHCYQKDFDGTAYLYGPAVDRLHEFEKLGYEPEDLKRIIERHHEMNRYSRDAFDALYYAYKKAGEIENSLCDDIRSIFPSTIFTKEGFTQHYAKNDEYRKLVNKRIERVMGKLTPLKDAVDEKIVEAITRPVNYQKVWVTTSSSVKDDELTKKLKEVAEELKKGFEDGLEHPKKNPWLDFKHQFTATFNYQDTDAIQVEHEKVDWNKEIEKYIKYDIDFTKNMLERRNKTNMTVTKNPEHQFKIKKVLFNNPATIVFWSDGDKTVVKAQNGEPYDPEKGLAMAISKKALGNDRSYYHTFAKFCKDKPSEVAHKTALDQTSEELLNSLYASKWAYDILEKVYKNPKATKAELLEAINLSLGGLYEYAR